MRRVVVTGLGCITPLGVGVKLSWDRLVAGHCGIVSTLKAFPREPAYATVPSQVAAVVPRGPQDGQWDVDRLLEKGYLRKMAQFSQYAVIAASEALEDAGWNSEHMSEEQIERAGVCIGSGIGSFDDVYDASIAFKTSGYKTVNPHFVPRLLINMAAAHVTMKYNFKGPNHAVSTACTTGLHSIGDASRFITHGSADIMVAGGAESCIHPLAIAGFARARSLSTEFNNTPEISSRPFDKRRNGFVIGEGAGILVLEELEHALRRGVKKIYAEVKGYGLSADAYHITAPPKDGRGAFRAMKTCLKDALMKPKDVDYVNAHATGTILGDAAENQAIKKLLLGEEGKARAEEINVSSNKGAMGHLLGAAGAVESVMTILTMHNNILPPTINLDQPGDPLQEFDCNYVPNRAQQRNVDVALCNSFGFGGTNASLCFSKFR